MAAMQQGPSKVAVLRPVTPPNKGPDSQIRAEPMAARGTSLIDPIAILTA